MLVVMKSALIVWGGWDGHEPDKVAEFFSELLVGEGYHVTKSDSLDAFGDKDKLGTYDLIVPVWTMGEITWEQCDNVCAAVESGAGLAGCHGGMCDAFRSSTEWHYLTGGQWVAHPGDDGVPYTVTINRSQRHEITEGLADFEVESEQYYLHTDPGNVVLATCEFPNHQLQGRTDRASVVARNNPCAMPTLWIRRFGQGKVFYNALGHKREVLENPTAKEICRRGLIWATR